MTGDGRSRRSVLAAASVGALSALGGCVDEGGVLSLGADPEKPTVAILEDRSQTFALTGTPKYRATKLAVEEINRDGGILGQEIDVFAPDPQSDNMRYQDLTRHAIYQEDVDALWAGYSSATREAIRPIVNDHEQLYFYTTQYEGGVCDRSVFPLGATARQQLGAVVPYLIEEYGDEIYTVAADYNFGQLSGDWVRIIAEEHGAEVVGEEYVPLDESQFGSTINRIQSADPDFMMSMLVGQDHSAFYEQRLASGLEVPVGTSTNMAQAYEHLRIDPPALKDVYAGVNYMEELPTDRNEAFVERYHDRWDDDGYLNQEAQNNYFSVYVYKKGVERAGTFDQAAVIDALEEGIEVEAPEGDIALDPATHHMEHNMRVAHADENHEITFDAERKIEPAFLHDVGCDLTSEDEQTQYEPDAFYEEA
ncbi:urea ABC transporter substrate-binding protein [Natronococcus pandeyae]|uniref:Urea ABC transporter substrate-binding protein n=1 Tax=Natronococcus pandeyae TaxID=2055836 RepID=A0A8J8TSI2_9EURY|nr:urea ABC transporter substrate-binding protein [Natronococcus pandeyae]TYL40643.1 urea ABC transporter substrate-binding protein [Natronococcus pandeyae]